MYAESRKGFSSAKHKSGRLNLIIFPEFWHNKGDNEAFDGSKPIPSAWIQDVLAAVQIQVRKLLHDTEEQHLVAINLTSLQTDEKDQIILMTDPESKGQPRPQALNQTFWVDPEAVQSFSKSAFSNIDNMGNVGNYFKTKLGGSKAEESRGYVKLLDGGYFFLENRICLDITHSFEETWVKRPDAMLVLACGTPEKIDWDLTYKPYAVLVADTFWARGMGTERDKPINGLHASPEFPGYQALEAAKESNVSFLGKFLNIVQAYTQVSMDSLRTFFFGGGFTSTYLYGGVPQVIKHESEAYGNDTMFVVADIEFQNTVTEKELDGAAQMILDGKLYYTQPPPKTNNEL